MTKILYLNFCTVGSTSVFVSLRLHSKKSPQRLPLAARSVAAACTPFKILQCSHPHPDLEGAAGHAVVFSPVAFTRLYHQLSFKFTYTTA
jgi:hypothetical protein